MMTFKVFGLRVIITKESEGQPIFLNGRKHSGEVIDFNPQHSDRPIVKKVDPLIAKFAWKYIVNKHYPTKNTIAPSIISLIKDFRNAYTHSRGILLSLKTAKEFVESKVERVNPYVAGNYKLKEF